MSRALNLIYDEAYDKVKRGFERKEKDGLAWVYAKDLCDAGAQHGFTTRHGGVSELPGLESLNFGLRRNDPPENIHENYLRLATAADFPYDSMAEINHEHGDVIQTVSAKDRGRGIDENLPPFSHCDGLISNDDEVTLITSHADCMAVFLMEPNCGAIAGIHSGWKGTSLRIAAKAVQCMEKDFGGKAERTLAAIGPSISQKHFEVDKPVYDIFAENFSDVEASYFNEETGKYHIDLWKIMVAQLIEAGIQAKNITLAGLCTYENQEDYYSYRRDGMKCGSMIGFIRKDGR